MEYNNAELLTKMYILTSAQDTEAASYSNGGSVSSVYDKYGNLNKKHVGAFVERVAGSL